MASKIQILSPELSNKIAAGEVVQRPASAVKELIENAIDAKATRISVIIKDAGKALIQIIDNGEGMSEQDASLAFRRHSTSKIRTVKDLEEIKTLGFRGEALASISSVSQVELKTKTENDELATYIKIEGDEIIEKSKTVFDKGTSIAVRNLYYNTPARRNFLKSKQTELKNITDVVIRMATAHPEIEWLYTSDDDVLLDLKKDTEEGRVQKLFTKKQAENLLPFSDSNDLLSINGYISKPNFANKSRADQLVFLNKRFIFNKMINHAVFHAYEHLLEKGSFPFFILHLNIDPKHVDVNVHPSKMEVKFEKESDIYRIVYSVIKKTLGANDIAPSISFKDGSAINSFDAKLKYGNESNYNHLNNLDINSAAVFNINSINQSAEEIKNNNPNIIGLENLDADKTLNLGLPTISNSKNRIFAHQPDNNPQSENKNIWQLHNKYILSQIKNGLMIIDQHVAHERILYERVLSNFQNSLPTSQQLLFPETIELSVSNYLLVKDLLPDLERLGFDLKLFGKNIVVIEGIPSDVKIGNEKKILKDVLEQYQSNENEGLKDVRDNLAKSFACKAAIKAGDRLNFAEMVALIEHLFLTKMPFVCPHGRPVIIKIPLEELDTRFGRT